MAIGAVKTGAAAANASAATSLAVPYPAGLAADDYLLVFLFLNTADESSTVPAGWTDLFSFDTGSNTSPTLRIYGKFATGSESGNLSCATPSVTSQGRMLAYSGVDLTTPIDDGPHLSERAAANTTFPWTDATAQEITPTVADATVIVAGCQNTNTGTWTPPTALSGFTELHDVASPTPKATIAHRQGVAAGGAGTVTLTSSTSTRGVAAALTLRPASGVTNVNGSAALAGTGAVSSSGVVGTSAGAAVTGTDQVTAAGTVGKHAAVSIAAAAVVTAAGVVGLSTGASVEGVGTITCAGVVGTSSGATVAGAGDVAAAGTVGTSSSTTVEGTGEITAAGTVGASSAADVEGTGSVDLDGTVGTTAAATLAGVGEITLDGIVTAVGTGAVEITGTAAVDLDGRIDTYAAATIAGVGTITAEGIVAEAEGPVRDLEFTGFDEHQRRVTFTPTQRRVTYAERQARVSYDERQRAVDYDEEQP